MKDTLVKRPPLKVVGTLTYSALRITLGILWLILAVETWNNSFLIHVQHYHEAVFQKPPGWLLPWSGTWGSLITPYPELFVGLARFFITLIAVILLIGFAHKTTCIFDILFSLSLWALMKGYENTYALGAINLGATITYILVFLSLILIERLDGTTPYSVDYYLGRAAPNLWSAFHVIGSTFEKVYPNGDASYALTGVSTYTVGSGEGAVFNIVMHFPGSYHFVDHSMASIAMGAMRTFSVH